jgi:hypothetical protein
MGKAIDQQQDVSTRLRRLTLAAAAAAVTLLGVMGTQPSFADSNINGDGVGASFQSRGEKFRLWDNGCDGHAVYILYRVDPSDGRIGAQRRLDYDGGCRTMGLFDLNLPEKLDVVWKTCVNLQFRRDRCSFDEIDKT